MNNFNYKNHTISMTFICLNCVASIPEPNKDEWVEIKNPSFKFMGIRYEYIISHEEGLSAWSEIRRILSNELMYPCEIKFWQKKSSILKENYNIKYPTLHEFL